VNGHDVFHGGFARQPPRPFSSTPRHFTVIWSPALNFKKAKTEAHGEQKELI
jgi:hypothetical protein